MHLVHPRLLRPPLLSSSPRRRVAWGAAWATCRRCLVCVKLGVGRASDRRSTSPHRCHARSSYTVCDARGCAWRVRCEYRHLQPLSAVVLAPDSRRTGAEAEVARVSRQLEREREQLRLLVHIRGAASDVATMDDRLQAGGSGKLDKVGP